MTHPASEVTYNLELLSGEAGILKAIIGRIEGSGIGRKFINELYDVLARVDSNTHVEFKGTLK